MLTSHSDHLQIDWETGGTGRYHWVWLRQACECAECFNGHCRQRHFDPGAIAPGIRPERVSLGAHGLRIVWQDAHVSTYALDRLARDDYRDGISAADAQAGPPWTPWPERGAPASSHFSLADVLEGDAALRLALNRLFESGLVVLKADGGATRPFDEVRERLAGFLDPSYFGEFFDLEIKSDDATDSVSFSTKALPLHTDIPYCSPPPDYQFLFGLDVDPRCAREQIGCTRFVDGWAVLSELRDASPDMFDRLAHTNVVYRAEYPNARKRYEHRTPIVRLRPDGCVERLINNPTKMFFDGIGFDDLMPFFRAYHALKARLVATRRSYLHTWTQGDMVVWDNRRIFHGRGDFGAPGIVRTLRGGYFKEGELRAREAFIAAAAAARRAEG
ncbi:MULTISPECIES: TauD/TfdA family dioxygenase [Burkholderia]|uniref:TauD/TfdA family dioxygenase n=1 Tax=Burkholderia TaxID=32008 RepID=UPI00075E51FF|nr:MULTISPECIES: TauD/TfdA family dioxygenase [Burkholderia]AOJ71566.1 gamma-butyrobetaine,2-oxoglutarate dioxygenase [Burkholderia savannae]KVG42021.1 gamma-butyrobetaine,2-oxoglutarate dioxygenase [Burkholderia sp. MSMB0265]KVG89806.1 gamma-butyrobetaine,2-oxoglutarate dioxygenase [Burkholderia sp. MSMB2040]KVG93596.1 gamma-butyrobetaine,2-oxoglutarate dioxygenase [Burkholderia sp. MSMB2042]KVG96981.1 gamma-butyrobetaine,2-oxoglutarate dioxygenase [Burkholderia sp. MSMB2041]